MYAIARIAGKQYRIEPDQDVKVPLLDAKEGSTYNIEDILLAVDDKGVQVGDPLVKSVKIKTKVVSHGQYPKITVFKKKRRQGFKVTKGHKQDFTLLHIEKIEGLTTVAKKAEKPKKEAEPKAKPKAEVKPKKAAPKKPAAKPKAEAKPKEEKKAKTPAKKKAEEKPKAEAKPKKAAPKKSAAKPKAEAKPKPKAKPKAKTEAKKPVKKAEAKAKPKAKPAEKKEKKGE
jgi:large subunit ribosomal protein L21